MKKLSLNKRTITKLSKESMAEVKGGAAWTTSFGQCTHFICCEPQPRISEVPGTCLSDGDPHDPRCWADDVDEPNP